MVASLALGLGSAWYMVTAPRTNTVEVGTWRAFPPSDAATADPYLRARVARSGEFGMGTGTGLTFGAANDSNGRSLSANCDYVIAGKGLQARLWTLTAATRDGRSGVTPEGRAHVDSHNLVRDASGRFEVVAAAKARAGNWLPLPAGEDFTLTLRLYDTPLALGTGMQPELPTITRGTCR